MAVVQVHRSLVTFITFIFTYICKIYIYLFHILSYLSVLVKCGLHLLPLYSSDLNKDSKVSVSDGKGKIEYAHALLLLI